MKNTLTDTIKRKIEGYNYIIIDGMYMCYKYYYGLSLLKNRVGERTGLYHGFLQLIAKLRKENLG